MANHGVRGIHWAEWLLLFVSSVGFGVAHLSSQSNWDVGKISTAALSGFIIGLSYLAYGAYAAILLHWFFNYYIQFYPLISTASLMAGSPLGPTMGALDYLTYAWSTILGALGLVLAAKEISSKRAVSR